MKILILGSTGMLGSALVEYFGKKNFEYLGMADNGGDVSFDIREDNRLIKLIKEYRPDVVINTVALINHSSCEEDPGKAYAINARPVAIIANVCRDMGIYFIHISTDHYFTGNGNARHNEQSPVVLLSEYARTKYAAELFALTNPEALVIRTNIVGFRNVKGQPTFAEWAIETMKSGVPFTMFNDYFTSSLDVYNFSKIVVDLIEKKPFGILHVASHDVSSKQRFIEALADTLNLSTAAGTVGSVQALTHQGMRRAESNGLDVSKVEALLGYQMPDLHEVMSSLLVHYKE